jgi:hypothetical protein
MNSLKFVTQIKGVYEFVKEEVASPTHNLSDPHCKEGEGSREGTRLTSTFNGWQLGGSPPASSMGTRQGWRRGASSAGASASTVAGGAGPLRWGRRRATAAVGGVGLLRPPVPQGHGIVGRWLQSWPVARGPYARTLYRPMSSYSDE